MRMNSLRLFKTAINAIKDPERDFSERIFLIFTFMTEIAVIIALIGDLLTKENPYEIVIIVSTILFVPVLTLICLSYDKLNVAIRITVIVLVFVILPGLFFFGGGLEGGGVIWIIFAFMYVGLVLQGQMAKDNVFPDRYI